MSESETGKAAAAKAHELKEAITKLDPRDRVIFLGSAALVILFFLPWWRVEVQIDGSSESWSGLQDTAWLGFLAACLGTVAGLARMGFMPLPPDLKRLAGKTEIQLGLAAAALLIGPVYFWGHMDAPLLTFGVVKAGKTLFFWLAFLAAAAAAGAAGWKFADERKAAAKPPA